MYKSFLRVLKCDLSLHATILGYIFGLVFPAFTGGVLSVESIPELGSVFLQKGGFSLFMQTASEQAIYTCIIFFIGFIPYAGIISSCVLFIRSFASAYSSLMLALGGASEALYVLHTFSSVFILCICFALSRCAYKYSHSENQSSQVERTISYALEFFFFTGLMFIVIFCRNVALAFV